MADRQQLVNSVYSGYGGIGNDTGAWPEWDVSYPDDIPQREQDLEQARALLKEAGYDGMSTSIRLGEAIPGMVAAGEILIQQAKAIGMNVKENKFTDLAQFYGSNAYYTTPIKVNYDYTQTMYLNLFYCLLPNTVFNSTSYDNPKVNALTKEALTVDGDAYNEKIAEVTKIVHDDGPWLVWGRRDIPDAISKKFTGLVPDAAGTGFNGNYLEEISQA
jgi:peptide/nickel transport system substrate-binding protein